MSVNDQILPKNILNFLSSSHLTSEEVEKKYTSWNWVQGFSQTDPYDLIPKCCEGGGGGTTLINNVITHSIVNIGSEWVLTLRAQYPVASELTFKVTYSYLNKLGVRDVVETTIVFLNDSTQSTYIITPPTEGDDIKIEKVVVSPIIDTMYKYKIAATKTQGDIYFGIFPRKKNGVILETDITAMRKITGFIGGNDLVFNLPSIEVVGLNQKTMEEFNTLKNEHAQDLVVCFSPKIQFFEIKDAFGQDDLTFTEHTPIVVGGDNMSVITKISVDTLVNMYDSTLTKPADLNFSFSFIIKE